VTLLFTDQVGSTELLGELGDDEAERLRRLHFGLLRDVAAAHDGEEVKNLGDGLMVVFASAVNAVDCAIAIQQEVHRQGAGEGDRRLTVRVGLNVGEPIRDEGDYFGTPVVIAKRLCDSAGGGQILASELLRALVGSRGSFTFRSLGTLPLKGIPEPLPACEIVWEPAVQRRIALPAPLVVEESAPLVGRDHELDELQRCWQEVRRGRRRVAMVVGEPGIGKTRLAAEFCRNAAAEEAVVLLGRCYEESLVPYQAFVEALRHYISESPSNELRLLLGPHRPALARLLPELAEDRPQALAPASAEQPEREQFVLFDAVASVLTAVASARPLVVALDDLHWADAPTLLLLRHVVRASEAARLLILGTYRATEVDETHPLEQALAELRRARALDSLMLKGLAEEHVAELISAQAGRTAPAAFARSIVDRTRGNPFFVEELLRQAAGGDDFAEALTRIPESVKDLLMRRLRRLDDSARRLLTFGAVSGREFELDVLERVAGMPAGEIAESLEAAIAGHIVEESASSIGRYAFAHALIRETIYEQVSATRRAQLHRQIAEAIESAAGDRADEQAVTLAHHFSAAGDVAKAYQYHSRAAAAAQSVYAIEPALAHYSVALDAAAELGLEADREPVVRGLLLQRGRMRFRTGDVGGATADFEVALASARRCDDREVEMETLNELGIMRLGSDLQAAAATHEAALEIARELDDPAAQTHALDRLAVIASHRLEFDRALELGERALALARETGDETAIGRANDSIKLALWQVGDLPRLERLTAELERLWRERGDLWYLQWTLLEAAFVPIGRARWDDAVARLEDARAINRRTLDPGAEVLMLDAVAWMNRSRGAYEEALSAGRRAVEVAGQMRWPGWASATLAWTLLDLRAAESAAEVLERGLGVASRTGRAAEITRCVAQLAWARSLLGDLEGASALAARAEALLARVTAPPGDVFLFGAHAYAATARVLIAAGAPERGEALLLPVLKAAERSGWFETIACSELVLGLCLEARGELKQAIARLEHAVEVSDDHGIPAPGWEAHAVLARLGAGDEHAAASRAIIERMTASLKDRAERDRLRSQLSP
jgi:class 3 adenylate cyclase/tetratricopeptide (TPR) repeat protein